MILIKLRMNMISESRIISVENVKKAYGNKVVVEDVSLKLRQGEIVGLLGPNGAGKTTTFYMIVGLVGVTDGKIYLDERDITNIPMYKRAMIGISYLPQETSIFRGMTVADNIYSILEISEKNKRKRLKKLDELLNEFSITHLKKSMAMSLSGGERRRVEIARALATNPSFILLDEPFAGIDPIAVSDIANIIVKLKNMGIGILITDHNVRETLLTVDRAYIVHNGRILASGSKDEIINNEEVKKFYLGDKFSNSAIF